MLARFSRRTNALLLARFSSSLTLPNPKVEQLQEKERPGDLVNANGNRKESDSIIVSGYDAWWRIWQEQRATFPGLGVEDILASQGTVVLDANIGAIFARLELDNPSPDRQAFLSMLHTLLARGRLCAPPKLMHRYAIAINRGFNICIPCSQLEDADRNSIGHMAQQMMQWIVDANLELPRDAPKSMDFLVTLLQCAFLYKSTLLLTNNKDYYFVLKAAKQLEETMHASYPEYAATIRLSTVRIVYVLEQLKINVYQKVRI